MLIQRRVFLNTMLSSALVSGPTYIQQFLINVDNVVLLLSAYL